MAPRKLQLTAENLAVAELPGLVFNRHLLMYETRGHREALELEVAAGAAPSRATLLGKTLVQG